VLDIRFWPCFSFLPDVWLPPPRRAIKAEKLTAFVPAKKSEKNHLTVLWGQV